MLLARSGDGSRIHAHPDAIGVCPNCDEHLLPKCGPIVTWHWSHWARLECDPWTEPESESHLARKAALHDDLGADIEVGCTVDAERHPRRVSMSYGRFRPVCCRCWLCSLELQSCIWQERRRGSPGGSGGRRCGLSCLPV